jgi:RimJ/RimL family protein N-acetyltransferase
MALFPDRIGTDRLALEAASTAAVDPLTLYGICSGAGIERVTEYVPWDPHAHPKETADLLDSLAEEHAAGEGAHYLLRPREGEDGAGELAGMCGLTVDWERRVGKPGVWLRERFWGRGYSGERARALAALAFERLDLDCLVVRVRAGNDRSKRAVDRYVEAMGGRYEGLCRYADAWDGPVDLHRWTVTRAEYDGAGGDATVTFDPDPDTDERA